MGDCVSYIVGLPVRIYKGWMMSFDFQISLACSIRSAYDLALSQVARSAFEGGVVALTPSVATNGRCLLNRASYRGTLLTAGVGGLIHNGRLCIL